MDNVNPDDGLEDFDLSDGTQPKVEPTGDKPTPDESSFIQAGGRKFPNQDELVKAYTNLEKAYSRSQGDWAKAKPWYEFGQQVQRHPDLHADLNKRITDYQKRLSAGQSETTARKASGLPDEVTSELQAIRADLEDRKLKEEISDLKARFNVEQGLMDEVLKHAHDKYPIELEDAYWAVVGRKQAATSRTQAEAKVKAELKAKSQANVGASQVAPNAVLPKDGNQMSKSEKRAEILKRLQQADQ